MDLGEKLITEMAIAKNVEIELRPLSYSLAKLS